MIDTQETTCLDDDVLDDAPACSASGETCARMLTGINTGTGAVRIDAFLAALGAPLGISREKVKKAVADGHCVIDGKTAVNPARKITPGQTVSCEVSQSEATLQPSLQPVDVMYEDAHMAVVVKPAGLTVHPCPSCTEETLVHRLIARFPQLRAMGGLRPGIVHRLDKDTSGLIIIALTEQARLKLAEAFATRNIHKTYLALVRGCIPAKGTCTASIGRHPTIKTKMAAFHLPNSSAKEALTEFTRLYAASDQHFSLTAVRLHSGRTHQIRVHFSDMGHPLLGDSLYGSSQPLQHINGLLSSDPAPRQMLHAWKLSFRHPITGTQLDFELPPPADFMTTAEALLRTTLRCVLTGLPGCGKSAVLDIFHQHGFPTWSADGIVAELYAPNGLLTSEINRRYGDSLVQNGAINKKTLFAQMVSDAGFRREIENLVHPLVAASLMDFYAQAEADGAQAAVAEVPLWFESRYLQPLRNTSNACMVIGVACQRDIRHQRLAERRHWSPETIATMDAWQWPEERKMAACAHHIPNNADVSALKSAVEKAIGHLQKAYLARQKSRLEEYLSAIPSR